jgi:UDP-glucose 4-epimerase
VHCAGTSLVGPSVTDPAEYYDNNFYRTKCLLDNMREWLPNTRIIFSSSASVYGSPLLTPCHEVDPVLPISPYGQSKAMIEWMLQSYHRAYQLPYVAFRYFNACGADSTARHGQAPGASHIIARVLECLRDDREFTMFGRNYPTTDGTCRRDYVHVQDIADAHVAACENLVPNGIYNLGLNTAHSNQEIVYMAQKITGRNLRLVEGEQRAGDPAELVACADLIQAQSNWRPRYQIHDMITHAWRWYLR